MSWMRSDETELDSEVYMAAIRSWPRRVDTGTTRRLRTVRLISQYSFPAVTANATTTGTWATRVALCWPPATAVAARVRRKPKLAAVTGTAVDVACM